MKRLKYLALFPSPLSYPLVPKQYRLPNNSFNPDPTRRRPRAWQGQRESAGRDAAGSSARGGGRGVGTANSSACGQGAAIAYACVARKKRCAQAGRRAGSASDQRRCELGEWGHGGEHVGNALLPQSAHGTAAPAEVHAPEYERVRRTSELYVSRTVFTHPAAAHGVANLMAGASVRVVALREQSPVLQNVYHRKFCS
jgi:hypothetical protein